MANHVIQFPVRNAFYAQRAHDALARDPYDHTRRIAQQVDDEIARQAFRRSSGRSAHFAATRSGALVTMPARKPFTAIRAFASRLLARA